MDWPATRATSRRAPARGHHGAFGHGPASKLPRAGLGRDTMAICRAGHVSRASSAAATDQSSELCRGPRERSSSERCRDLASRPATDVFKNISGAKPEVLKHKEPARRKPAKPAADKTRLVIAGAAAAAAAADQTVGIAIFLSSSKKPDNSPTVAQTAKTQQPPANQPETLQSALRPSQAVAALSKPIGQPTAPDLTAASSLRRLAPPSEQPAPPAPIESAENSPSEEADAAPATKKTPTQEKGEPDGHATQPPDAQRFLCDQPIRPVAAAQAADNSSSMPAGKNLERARSHRGENCIPGGMYSLSQHQCGSSGRRTEVCRHRGVARGKRQQKRARDDRPRVVRARGRTWARTSARLLDQKFLHNSVAILDALGRQRGRVGLVRGRVPREMHAPPQKRLRHRSSRR